MDRHWFRVNWEEKPHIKNWLFYIQFMFSKKVPKIDEIFTVDLTITTYILSNWRWRFCQFLWPSQKTWTLTNSRMVVRISMKNFLTSFGSFFSNQIKQFNQIEFWQHIGIIFDISTAVCSSDVIPIGEIIFSDVFLLFRSEFLWKRRHRRSSRIPVRFWTGILLTNTAYKIKIWNSLFFRISGKRNPNKNPGKMLKLLSFVRSSRFIS